jgi:hypothetical protein
MSSSDRPTDRPAEYSEVFTIIPPVSVKGNTYKDVSNDPIKQSSQTMELYNRWLELYHGLDDSDRFSLLEMNDVFIELSISQKNIILKLIEEFYKSNNLRK